MVNGIVSLISLSIFSLLVYRSARDAEKASDKIQHPFMIKKQKTKTKKNKQKKPLQKAGI